ncbi:MAG: hypothetical protein KGJ93_04805 [Patescibacteria group bacterium]|nr:hypothetical protein [Patescibacteria group bacterium]
MQAEIVDYIKQAHEHGLADGEIKQNLLDVGWEAGEVEDSFAYVKVDGGKGPAFPGPLPIQVTPLRQQQDNRAEPTGPKPLGLQPTKLSVQTLSNHGLLSDQHFIGQPLVKSETPITESGTAKKKHPFIITMTLVLLLLATAATVYAVMLNPEKVWQKFLTSAQSGNYNSDISLKLTTQNASSGSETLTIQSQGSTQEPDFSQTLKFNYATSGPDQTRTTQLIVKNQILYFEAGSIPEFKSSLGADKTWVKFDFQKFAQLASSSPAGKVSDWPEQLRQIWNPAKLAFGSKLLGLEKINGTFTAHVQLSLNRAELKNAIAQTFNLGATIGQSNDTEQAKQDMLNYIDKIAINKFEAWIGLLDSRLYRLRFDALLPDVPKNFSRDVSMNPFSGQIVEAADQTRYQDAKNIRRALELYYNDHGGYPAAQNGVPTDLMPNYLSTFPRAPEPASGPCSEYYNTYWYSTSGQPHDNNGKQVYPNYQMTFCLGQGSNDYQAGIGQVTPAGIETGLPCNDKPENCQAADAQAQSDQNTKLNLQASLRADFSDYGMATPIIEPQNAFDILSTLEDQLNSTTTSPAVNY